MQEDRGVNGWDDKGTRETLGDDGCVHYLGNSGDFWAFTYSRTYQLVQLKCVPFIAYQ